MDFCVDFDGTCTSHDFPRIGHDIGAVPVLKRLVASGHRLILFTMRSDIVGPTSEDKSLHLHGGNYLSDAVDWFKKNDIPLYGIQTNPTQSSWTHSPKAYGHHYIDDAAIGCPLIKGVYEKPFVDWVAMELLLEPFFTN